MDESFIEDEESEDVETDASVSFPRIEALSKEQITNIAQNHLVISAIENGKSVKEALELASRHFPKFVRTERWGQQLRSKYEQIGSEALVDKRQKNKNQNTVLTLEIQRITLAWWYIRNGAGSKEIWRQVKKECKERNFKCPSYESVQKFLKNQTAANKLVRAGKIKVWDKQGRPVVRFNLTNYSNQRWQIDHTRLDIWVRLWVIDRWEPRQVWLTVVLDVHSRSIAGFVVSSKTPDAWTTATLLRQAILPKENSEWFNRGICSVLQPDRGKDFMSHAVTASVAMLGIIFDPDPPYYPNRKGKVERFFLTLDHHLRILSGHHKGIGKTEGAAEKRLSVLLTLQQLQSEIEHWIVTEYHQRENSETKRKPAELWEETVLMRMPESETALDSFLLKSDKVRVIRNTGIDFHIPGKGDERGGRFWAPEMSWFYKREVKVSYNPEDLNSILVYCATTSEYIGEAWLMGDKDSKYSIADVRLNRNQARKGLLERMKMYSAEIHADDRRTVKRENWRRARANAKETRTFNGTAQTPGKNKSKIKIDNEKQVVINPGIEALLNKMEAHDRGDYL